MNLTNDDVEEIIRALDSSYFNELRLKTEKFDLYLRRSQASWTQEMHTLASPNLIGDSLSESTTKVDEKTESKQPEGEVAGLAVVKAPMVGTFYRAPKPGAPPFVDIGSIVGEHTVVGIVETMKLMNSVSAGISGKIVEICVLDGQLVEAEHVLMRVKRVDA
jgi:acetyl-CoA carboxylase biotin carboxyl carrier protein